MLLFGVDQITDELIDELFDGVVALIPQLTKRIPPTKTEFKEIVSSPNTMLIIAKENSKIVGMATFILYRTPSSLKSRIEDVVVDEEYRGKGIGESLVSYAIGRAICKKVSCIELESREERESAHRLYERMGFEEHDTTVFRYYIPQK